MGLELATFRLESSALTTRPPATHEVYIAQTTQYLVIERSMTSLTIALASTHSSLLSASTVGGTNGSVGGSVGETSSGMITSTYVRSRREAVIASDDTHVHCITYVDQYST